MSARARSKKRLTASSSHQPPTTSAHTAGPPTALRLGVLHPSSAAVDLNMAPSIKKKGPVRADATSMSTHAKSRAKTRMTDSAVGDSDNPRENKNRRSRGRRGRAGIDSDDESMKDGTNQAANTAAKKVSKGSANFDDESNSDASSLSSTPILSLKRPQKMQQNGKTSKPNATTAKNDNGKSRKRNKSTSVAAKTAEKSTKKVVTTKSSAKIRDSAQVRKPDDDKTKKRAPSRTKAPTKSSTNDELLESDGSASSDEEEAGCCLCFCGVDCSDRALFFPKDRKEELEDDEDYYFSMDDPFLDESLYDRNNALVYCDSCNRLYHQKCHFVPLLVIPRGDWHCLICSIQKQPKLVDMPASKSRDKKHSKKRKRSGGKSDGVESNKIVEMPMHEKAEWKKFLSPKVTDLLFRTPVRRDELLASGAYDQVDFLSLQKEWELASAVYKAQMLQRQLKHLKVSLSSQASNIRMANTALITMTSTKRNRQHFSAKGAKSQELAQTIVRKTSASFKIRDALLSLENLRTRDEPVSFKPLIPWCQENPVHASHVFPFGVKVWKEGRRIVPRTKERELAKLKGALNEDGILVSNTPGGSSIPSEIHLTKSKEGADSHSKKESSKQERSNSKGSKKKNVPSTKTNKHDGKTDDDDSGVSLDDLQCCVCMVGDSTDENDVLLCDGQNCHRAFHMKCVYPAVTMEQLENENEDWFCPLCTGVSNLMGEMHDLCVGSEDADCDGDNESLESWENVQDVFPSSLWEYETAMKLLKGKRNGDTQRLLALYLGEDIDDKPEPMPIGSDSEDENDYSLFDEKSFEQRKRKDREQRDESDGGSTHSSQATLVGMSSVEYNVGKDELAALAEGDDDDSENSGIESNLDSCTGRIRKSRRIRKRVEGEEEDSKSADFGADFSEANILEGKRKRNRVDYRKLNDALFGDLDDKQKSQIDDNDDFEVNVPKKKQQDQDEDSDSSSSDNDGSNEPSDEDGSSSNDNEEDGDDDAS